jgi:hypothetical protein
MQSARRVYALLGPLALMAAVPCAGLADDTAAHLLQIKTMFDPAAIVSGPDMVDCTLSGETKTTCFRITGKSSLNPGDMGPWCPRNIEDGPDLSGIWLHGGTVYDADGAFVRNLSTFYDDPAWQMYDPATRRVNVTDSKQSCDAAARPDVDPAYNNDCVDCLTSYMEDEAVLTYVMPLVPVDAATPVQIGPFAGIGLAFNGIKFDAPAPQDAILDTHTLAPFDDCGGHVNLHVGYHYHTVTGCSPQIAATQGHSPIIGIAMDGYPLIARLDANGTEPADPDVSEY